MVNLRSSSLAASAWLLFSISTDALEAPPGLDTSQGLEVLDAEYQVGLTYVENIELDQTTKMDFQGVEMDQTMHMEMDDEMSVSQIPAGGKQIDILYKRVAVSMEVMGQIVKFDSDAPEDSDPTIAAAFEPLVGETFTVIVDDENQVAEAKDHEELLQGLTDTGNDAVQGLASPKKFEQMARITKALPEMPVKPGDSWEIDVEMDDMMRLQGVATLSGYLDFGGNFCAVVLLDGSFNISLSEVASMFDDEGLKQAMQGTVVKDGHLAEMIYFDNEAKFARYTESITTMTMQMTSPIDGTSLDVPLEQVMKVNVDIKE